MGNFMTSCCGFANLATMSASSSCLVYSVLICVFSGLRSAVAAADTAGYELHPALEMSLFAKEPDVVDPVALRWGLDNRVHGVNGGNGGKVISTRRGGPPLPLGNLDFNFDPATGDLAPTYQTSAGFGLVFDEWGHSFVTYNINHIQQRMIPAR